MPLQTFGEAEGIKDIFRRAPWCCVCQLIMTSLAKRFKAPQILSIVELGKSVITAWIQPLVIFTIAKYHCSFVNILAIPTIQRHAIADVWQDWRDQRHFSPCTMTLRVPVNYDVACQTIQSSADSFYCGTWKICHHGREFNLWWYSPLHNTTAHL